LRDGAGGARERGGGRAAAMPGEGWAMASAQGESGAPLSARGRYRGWKYCIVSPHRM